MVLYIAKRGLRNVGSVTHLQALKDIYGEKNVFIVDLISSMKKNGSNYVAYKRTKNIFERLVRWSQGNTSYISNKIIKEICDIIEENKIDLVFSDESDLGNLMKAIKKKTPGTRIICFYHDISADLFVQRKKNMPGVGLHYKLIECNLTIRQERISQKYCDENWVFNVADAEKFKSFYGYEPTAIIPLASTEHQIPKQVRSAVVKSDESKHILFVCSAYYVNKLGFRWFYENVFPYISGDFQLEVVGVGSKGLAEFCDDSRVRLVGPVDDLSEYYLKADIVITPIFDGGGMKVKTLEAVSYAKCLIGTTESLHGFWEKIPLSIRDSIVYQCDAEEDWIKALNDMLHKRVYKFNTELYEVYRKFFSYEAMLRQFQENLKKK